jgi:hypothetical protein
MLKYIIRWDHNHFDEDIDMCVLLANEHIHNNATSLTAQEAVFYKRAMTQRKEEQEEKTQTRRISQAAYRQRKKQRIAELFQ